MSSGFSGSSTRSIDGLTREIESRMQTNQFQTDFEPSSRAFVETDESIIKKSGPYEKPHDDYIPEASPDHARMAAAGDPRDQEPMDALDREVQRYQSRVKDPADQFPMSKTLARLTEGVDETLWSKAKDASQQAFGRIKWPFVMYLYEEWGGK